jgi:hypothetical protein
MLVSSSLLHLAAIVAGASGNAATPMEVADVAPAAGTDALPLTDVAADSPSPQRGEGRGEGERASASVAASAPSPASNSLTQPSPSRERASAGAQTAPDTPTLDADKALIEGRRRPGAERELPERVTQENPGAVRPPPPEAFPVDQVPIPDRWRLIESLGVVKQRWFDPYHQNFYKGDRPINPEKKPSWLPIKGDDWFFVLNGISDTVVEPRSFPTPVNRQLNDHPGSTDVFGRDESLVLAQTFIVGAALIKGSTAYKPPDVEYRVTLAYNLNYVDISERRALFVQPSRKSHRFDNFLGVQELFIDKHRGNRSDRFDFDSVRIGIQPFQADFRGFLFNDNQLGIRFFGNRDNNRYQYNLAAFWRLEKDTNSGLNDVTQKPRHDFIFFGNLYAQDFPFPGLTSQVSATFNLNREKNDIHVDDNGFPVRPVLLGNLEGRNYEVAYLGYSADGRIGRLNLTTSLYAALGRDHNSFFTGKPADIQAFFGAAELSYDHNWMRFRLSGLYATGDGKPYDNKETGFDAIMENPIFAGADTSYWIRQAIPFAGGARVTSIQGRNGILNSLRSSKDEGQSNFNNPGTMLLGVGGDFDLTPKVRLSLNANHLWFETTKTLEALRNEGSIPKSIGWDLSAATIYRPKMVQNAVFRLSAALFDPDKGFRDLFTNSRGDDRYYSVLFNAILTF